MKKQPPRNIYCLEGNWRPNPRCKQSVRPMLDILRDDKIHLPQVQHAGRVLRIFAAIHVRTLPELYDSIHCLSRQTK